MGRQKENQEQRHMERQDVSRETSDGIGRGRGKQTTAADRLSRENTIQREAKAGKGMGGQRWRQS